MEDTMESLKMSIYLFTVEKVKIFKNNVISIFIRNLFCPPFSIGLVSPFGKDES